ncbi:hypothetical protein EVAR_68854_1 [Eumeta japonica]|uniref:Uncharacterized protein n=1 Tax=Eumeta variegata TaxID=151549 RepID=A0A4C1SSW3_EUMVA|nr:hypothetical protein EVAR_68854_1 [Eumeta japonica]
MHSRQERTAFLLISTTFAVIFESNGFSNTHTHTHTHLCTYIHHPWDGIQRSHKGETTQLCKHFYYRKVTNVGKAQKEKEEKTVAVNGNVQIQPGLTATTDVFVAQELAQERQVAAVEV